MRAVLALLALLLLAVAGGLTVAGAVLMAWQATP